VSRLTQNGPVSQRIHNRTLEATAEQCSMPNDHLDGLECAGRRRLWYSGRRGDHIEPQGAASCETFPTYRN
jgi:hypothetical protein